MPLTADLRARQVEIPIPGAALLGELTLPAAARCLVLFTHGGGSSRESSRGRLVAKALQKAGMGTLLLDLLSPEEQAIDRFTAHLRFDVPLLARRLTEAVARVLADPETRGLRLGCHGFGTGSGAALRAAAGLPRIVQAVVCCGGRPDLAGDALPRVRAPTLLLVGARDAPVLKLARKAMERMTALVQLEIIPRAGPQFEEPGTLEEVSHTAARWFHRHLETAGAPVRGPDPEVRLESRV